MANAYHVTNGRSEQTFPYTPEGLRAAWEFAQTLHPFAQITNPERVDLKGDDSGLSDGLTDEEQETLEGFDDERYREEHADEIAHDAYWEARIDEARGK